MSRDNDPLIGRVLDGRYRILAPIDRGGMATVYEAHDARLDRDVAVKVMHDTSATTRSSPSGSSPRPGPLPGSRTPTWSR